MDPFFLDRCASSLGDGTPEASALRLRAGDLVAFGLAGAYAWNISHHGFLMHPEPGFHHVGTG